MPAALPPEDTAEELLASCHGKMRQFCEALRRTVDAVEANPDGKQIPSAARAIARYFREALPMHAADEDESITPRLLAAHPELAGTLATLAAEHRAMDLELPLLCAGLDALVVGGDPDAADANGVDPEVTFAERSTEIVDLLAAHIHTEEVTWFPLFAQLPEAQRREVRAEMAARRGN